MAKITSSRRRSTRQASKRPTSSSTRASRSKSSNNSLKITRSGEPGKAKRGSVTSARRRSTRSTDKPKTQGRGVTRRPVILWDVVLKVHVILLNKDQAKM